MSSDYNYYEGMFVTKGGGGEDAWEQSRSAVNDVLEDHEAEIDYVENWADQQFEKEIEKQRRGKYVLAYFQADPSVIQKIKDDTQMNDRILRVLILNRDKESTYRDMIQERIEANKEDEEEDEEDEEEQEEEVDSEETATDEQKEPLQDEPAVEPMGEEIPQEASDESIEPDSDEDQDDESSDEVQEAEEELPESEVKTEAGVEES